MDRLADIASKVEAVQIGRARLKEIDEEQLRLTKERQELAEGCTKMIEAIKRITNML